MRGQDAALFLITNYDPDHLKWGYLAMMLVQLAAFLGSVGLFAHFWAWR